MKKYIFKIFLIISFVPGIIVIINIIKSYFFGFKIVMLSGLDIPMTYGIKAVGTYLWYIFSFNVFGIITIPIFIICITYQIYYFRKIKKKENDEIKEEKEIENG